MLTRGSVKHVFWKEVLKIVLHELMGDSAIGLPTELDPTSRSLQITWPPNEHEHSTVFARNGAPRALSDGMEWPDSECGHRRLARFSRLLLDSKQKRRRPGPHRCCRADQTRYSADVVQRKGFGPSSVSRGPDRPHVVISSVLAGPNNSIVSKKKYNSPSVHLPNEWKWKKQKRCTQRDSFVLLLAS